MASMGLRILIKCAKIMNSKKGQLALLAPNVMVEEIIQVSGVEEMISIFHSEAEAIAAVTPV